jgi:hypothetical protein
MTKPDTEVLMGMWFYFEWEVPEDGHKWVDIETETSRGKRAKVPHLTDGFLLHGVYQREGASEAERQRFNDEHARIVQEQSNRVVRGYRPLEADSELYRKFAEVGPSKDQILAFANEYGLLERPRNLLDETTTIWVTEHLGYPIYAEPRNKWLDEIAEMRRAVELWDAIRHWDKATLDKRIVWSEDGSVKYLGHDGTTEAAIKEGRAAISLIARPGIASYSRFFDHVKAGDSAKAGFYHLQTQVNKKLAGRIDATLLWDDNWDQLGLHHMPRGLLGAMWLQLAQALAGRRSTRACEVCGEPIGIGFYGARRDKRYCSGACQAKAYRDRKARSRAR